MDAAEYKHVVLGLIFLKYISDAFDERHDQLGKETAQGADPEDPDEYRAVNVFWVPSEARWKFLQANAKQPTIGKFIDNAMVAIERENPSLKGVLSKDEAETLIVQHDFMHLSFYKDDFREFVDTLVVALRGIESADSPISHIHPVILKDGTLSAVEELGPDE